MSWVVYSLSWSVFPRSLELRGATDLKGPMARMELHGPIANPKQTTEARNRTHCQRQRMDASVAISCHPVLRVSLKAQARIRLMPTDCQETLILVGAHELLFGRFLHYWLLCNRKVRRPRIVSRAY